MEQELWENWTFVLASFKLLYVQVCWCILLISGKVLNTYKGAAGSIRCVRCHQTLPVMAACGLDGFVRVYNLENKKQLHKVCHLYLICCIYHKYAVFTINIKRKWYTKCPTKTMCPPFNMHTTCIPHEYKISGCVLPYSNLLEGHLKSIFCV